MKGSSFVWFVLIFDLSGAENRFSLHRRSEYVFHNDPQNVDTYTYSDTDKAYEKDLTDFLLACGNCRVVFLGGMVFSQHSLRVATKQSHAELHCVLDDIFTSESQQICSLMPDKIKETKYPPVVVKVIAKPKKMLNISIIHLNRKPERKHEIFTRFHIWGSWIEQEYVQIKFADAYLNTVDGYNVKTHVVNTSRMYFPFRTSWFGFTLLNPHVCQGYNQPTSLDCVVPKSIHLNLINIDIRNYIWAVKTCECLFSAFFMLLSVFLMAKLCMFLSSDTACRLAQKSFENVRVTAYSAFFALALSFNILLGYLPGELPKRFNTIFINFFFFAVINSFTVTCLSIVVKCHYEMGSATVKSSRRLIIQDTISFLLLIVSMISALFVDANVTQGTSNFPYPVSLVSIMRIGLPIFSFFVIMYIFSLAFAVFSIYTMDLKNMCVYRFASNSLSPDARCIARTVVFSFVCVKCISLSLLFYIISSRVSWVHESVGALFLSLLFMVVYVISLSVGFNCEFYRAIRDKIYNTFLPEFKPFSQLRPVNYSSSRSTQVASIEESERTPSEVEATNPTHHCSFYPKENNTSLYYESYADLVPVFKLSPIPSPAPNFPVSTIQERTGSALLDRHWKSSGFSALGSPDVTSSTTTVNHMVRRPNPFSTNIESTRMAPLASTQNECTAQISESAYAKTDNDFEYITPEASVRPTKKYRRTPFRMICENYPRTDYTSYTIELDDEDTIS